MSDMEPCPFCGGSVERIEPGGQLWRGQGYSDPQFWTLRHFGKLSETDAFPTCTIQIRERTEDAAIAAWNRRAAHARIDAQAALIAELTEALRPFCFFDADHPKTDTTQRAWDIRYTDRFRDWIGFDDIEAARDAIARAEEAQK